MAVAKLVGKEFTYEFKTKCPRCKHKIERTERFPDRQSRFTTEITCECGLVFSERVDVAV